MISPPPAASAPDPGRRTLARRLAHDPTTLGGLFVLAALLAAYTLPGVDRSTLAAWSADRFFLPLLAWVVVSAFMTARSAFDPAEKRFWNRIGAGFACWLAAVLVSLLPAWNDRSPLTLLLYDGLIVAFYLALILATTEAPHDDATGRPRMAGARIVAAGIVVFGVGMWTHFDLVPLLVDRAEFAGRVPAFYLFLALDATLLVRAGALLHAARSSRWRHPYELLLASVLLLSAGDVLDLLQRLGVETYRSGTAVDFLWYAIFPPVALAARLRALEESPAPTTRRLSRLSGNPLLVFAFAVPAVHFALSGAGLLGARSQHPREAVALTTMAAILLLSWWHQTRLERSHRELQRELDHERERLRNAERLEAIGRLAGGVAHDFNNQLAIVVGYAELLAREIPKYPRLAEPVQAIDAAARYAVDLTRELLSIGQRLPLEARPFDLAEMLEALAPKLRARGGPRIRVEIHLPATPTPVLADRAQIERAVLELATNAIEAMPRGGTLASSVRRLQSQVGEEVELEVRDEGCGMTPEVRAHALEPFFTTKPFGQGSGLGLATVHGIVSQNGGTLSVESAPGSGTRVTLRLPLVGSSEEAAS